VSFTGRLYAVAALLEAFTWSGLLLGMVLRYVTETTNIVMVIFGRLHIGAFAIYFVVALWAALWLRWSPWGGVLALLAAIPPLATLPLLIWLHRRQLLRSWKKRDDHTVVATAG